MYKFQNLSNLERHIKKDHIVHQSYTCDSCDKTFVTKFRLRKHTKMHSDVKIGTCRYFRNNVFCPFEELGCKFLHSTDKSIGRLKSISVNNSGHIENNFEKINFFTSTPRKLVVSESYQNMKETFECEGCTNKTQCSVCFVDAYIQKRKSNQKQCRICDSFIKIGDIP